MPEAEERAHLREAIRMHTEATGERPLGWYTGRTSENSLKLVLEDGGFRYSSDTYADDLPYWVNGPKGPHLLIPYSLDANDMRFVVPQGFSNGDGVFAYLRDTFDLLYAEGERRAEDDVGRPALPAGRSARPRCGAHPFPRPRRQARPRLGRDAPRNRASIGTAIIVTLRRMRR